jgi:hypothetical protein
MQKVVSGRSAIQQEIDLKRSELADHTSHMETFDVATFIAGFAAAGFLGVLLAMHTSLSVAVNVTVLVAGVVSLVTLGFVFSKAERARISLRDEWTKFFAARTLVAPSGEVVKCVSCSESGERIAVVYDNGDQAEIPLGLLKDEKDVSVTSGSRLTDDQQLYQRMARVKWKTPGGQIGVVRNARYRYEADAELTLCLENGAVREFKLPDLEPVSG